MKQDNDIIRGKSGPLTNQQWFSPHGKNMEDRDVVSEPQVKAIMAAERWWNRSMQMTSLMFRRHVIYSKQEVVTETQTSSTSIKDKSDAPIRVQDGLHWWASMMLQFSWLSIFPRPGSAPHSPPPPLPTHPLLLRGFVDTQKFSKTFQCFVIFYNTSAAQMDDGSSEHVSTCYLGHRETMWRLRFTEEDFKLN